MFKSIYHYFQNRPLLTIGVIFLFWSTLNLLWAGFNKAEPHLDMTRHLYNSLIYDQEMQLVRPLRALVFWIDAYQYYPPFLYVVTKPFYLFGHTVFSAIGSNVIWLGLLLFGMYGIAKRIWNEKVALISVLLLAATPIFIGQFKEYMLDAPLAAWVVLTVYLIIVSKNFTNQFVSIILGLVLGLGMLLKWTYPVFIIFPLSYAILAAIIADWKNKQIKQTITAVFTLIATFAIAFPWYYIHRLTIYKDFIFNGFKGDTYHIFNIFSWIYYPIQGLNFYFFLPLGLLIIGGLFLSFTTKKYQNWLLGGA